MSRFAGYFLVAIAMGLVTHAKAQQTDTLRLKPMKEELVLSPMVEFMVKGLPNHFEVYVGGDWVVADIDVDGGVLLADSASAIVVQPNEDQIGNLELKFSLQNFKTKATKVVAREYYLLPAPRLYLHKTYMDSVILREDLIMYGQFQVKPEAYKVELASAQISFSENDAMVTVSYPFSPTAQRRWRAFVLNSKDGDVIQLTRILYGVNGQIIPAKSGAFYVTEDKPVLLPAPQTVIRK